MVILKRSQIAGSALIAAIVLVAVSGLPASAAESQSDRTQLIDRALAAVDSRAADTVTADSGVTISSDGASFKTIAGRVTATSLDPDDSEVRARNGGAQLLTVLYNGDDTARFSLSVPDQVSVVAAQGGFELQLSNDGTSMIIATIAVPWAIDATGNLIETHFAYSDGVITQSVDPVGATYPIVVDPLVTLGLFGAPYGPGFYINLTGAEMKAIAAATAVLGGGSLIALCSASNIPVPLARLAKAACFVGGGRTFAALVQAIGAIASNGQFANDHCYQSLIVAGRGFAETARSNCE